MSDFTSCDTAKTLLIPDSVSLHALVCFCLPLCDAKLRPSVMIAACFAFVAHYAILQYLHTLSALTQAC